MKATRITILVAALAALSNTATLRAADSPSHKKAGHESASVEGAVPKSYPLKKCVVSDDPLSGHGKSVKVTAPDGTDVYLCCQDCVKDFNKNPAKYAKIVKDAQHKK